MSQKLHHKLEALALRCVFALFRSLPLDISSQLGGFLARMIGPFLRAHRIAQRNLAMVFPEKSAAERTHILRAMWDHMGRVAAELPHLPGDEMITRVESLGDEHMDALRGKNILFFSGHIGNWELLPAMAERSGVPVALAYRAANNPAADTIIQGIRATRASAMFPKGPQGAVKLMRALKEGLSIAMLVDQKMNNGISVPFFGREAMTAPAIAQMALRYDLPILPARVIRTGGAHFKVVTYPPVAYEKTGDDEKDTLAIMTKINGMLETWVRDTPEQWFWVHRRWPS